MKWNKIDTYAPLWKKKKKLFSQMQFSDNSSICHYSSFNCVLNEIVGGEKKTLLNIVLPLISSNHAYM
jgi:hypothetical protein